MLSLIKCLLASVCVGTERGYYVVWNYCTVQSVNCGTSKNCKESKILLINEVLVGQGGGEWDRKPGQDVEFWLVNQFNVLNEIIKLSTKTTKH